MNCTAKSSKMVVGMCLLLMGSGCGPRLVMLERPKGEISLRQPEAKPIVFTVEPPVSSLSKSGIDVTMQYASPEELDRFFGREEIFGKLASKNPYPPETMIFYVKIFNHSTKKMHVKPSDFVMIDNLNIQYSELSADDISAIYEAKATVWSFAKTTGDLAPGPYGVPLKVASAVGGGGGRKLHYLIKQVRLAAGMVHPGIAYDGYVAFPRPHPQATSVRLWIGNMKTDFNAADEPTTSIDFDFSFGVKTSTP